MKHDDAIIHVSDLCLITKHQIGFKTLLFPTDYRASMSNPSKAVIRSAAPSCAATSSVVAPSRVASAKLDTKRHQQRQSQPALLTSAASALFLSKTLTTSSCTKTRQANDARKRFWDGPLTNLSGETMSTLNSLP